jgi:uncharacterized protein
MPAMAGRMPAITLPIGLLALAGCSTAPIAEADTRIDQSATFAFRLPTASLMEQRFGTVVRQRYDFSCGSAALATLLRYHYGEPQDETTVFAGMWRDGDRAQIRKLGFSLLDMKRYLAGRHLSADGYRVPLAEIARVGLPGIALIDFDGYKHFVVVKGVEGGSVLLGDPSLGLRWVSAKTFQRQWNGVFFALNDRKAVGQAHFDQVADTRLAPRGGYGPWAGPLSQQGLDLLRPGVNSF